MKKLSFVFGIIAMICIAIGFSSCEKESALQNSENTSECATFDECIDTIIISENEGEIQVRSYNDGISYTNTTPMGSNASAMEGCAFYIPAKTCYCVKLTDSFRTQFSSYYIYARFDYNYTVPTGTYFEFDRKRNWFMYSDLGDITTKTIYYGQVGETNSTGTQMEGGVGDPSYQWVRFRNPNNFAIYVVVTMRFNPGFFLEHIQVLHFLA